MVSRPCTPSASPQQRLSSASAAPQEGETAVHVGAGAGYYAAVLATLVGAVGQVLAYEVEPDIAERAESNLRHLPNVQVRAVSANGVHLPMCDVIYVNAGATHPPAAWLDALNVGVRLIFPLTPNEGFGVMLKVTRTGTGSYAAGGITRAAFIPCIGARDDAASESLAAAMGSDAFRQIRSLHRDSVRDGSAWYVGQGWWLSTQ